jgi:hypothetical protein
MYFPLWPVTLGTSASELPVSVIDAEALGNVTTRGINPSSELEMIRMLWTRLTHEA